MKAGKHSDVLMAAGLTGILFALILPLPTPLLDVLLTLNFAYVVLLLLISLNVKTPLELSVFPSLLLVGTLFRLALNVASTRLILLQAYAGKVIQSFGQFVVGGEVVVGLVIFAIIVVIQFVVITKGAERVSEVAARFTLDAMPGKQMSIDGDLSAGLIDAEEARRRRAEVVREADFYGAMDGASKFVRGDAIAGIVIVFVNLVGGLVVGSLRGMGLSQAVSTYSILTVGDGLVTQIPAVIMSVAAGILITKSSSDTGLSLEFGRQLLGNRKALGIASAIMFCFMLMPGLPTVPFMVLGVVLLAAYLLTGRGESEAEEAEREEKAAAAAAASEEEEGIGALVGRDRIVLEIGYNLISLVEPGRGGTLLERIKALRRKFARQMGIIVPKIRVVDNIDLGGSEYRIKISGDTVAKGEVYPGRYMVMKADGEPEGIDGIRTKEPSFGMPVVWVHPKLKELAESKGYTVVDAESVLITHLSEVIRRHAHEILNRQDVKEMLDAVRKDNPAIVEELVPDLLSVGQIQQVLQNLLAEGIPITNLWYILECMGNHARRVKDPSVLTEMVRKSLKRSICARFEDEDGVLHAVKLDPVLEQEIKESLTEIDGQTTLGMPPERLAAVMDAISHQLTMAYRAGKDVVVLTEPRLRPYIRDIVHRISRDIAVLAYDEVAEEVTLRTVGMVSVEGPALVASNGEDAVGVAAGGVQR